MTTLNGERLYRLYWQEMWAGNFKPICQWEQLTDDEKAPWNRTAYRLLQAEQPSGEEPKDE